MQNQTTGKRHLQKIQQAAKIYLIQTFILWKAIKYILLKN